MKDDGPVLQQLTRRLAETPEDFLARPYKDGQGEIHVAAVVSDLLRELGGELLLPGQADTYFNPDDAPLHYPNNVLVASWLLYDPIFTSRKDLAGPALNFLREGLRAVSGVVPAKSFVNDPERREELCRLVLAALGLRPAGETETQARDRLDSLDTLERQKVVKESKAQQHRLKKLLDAMREKAAREAAAKATPE